MRSSLAALLLLIAAAGAAIAADYVGVPDGTVLREAPAESAGDRATLVADDRLEVIERGDGWLRVAVWLRTAPGQMERVTGWVPAADARALSGTDAARLAGAPSEAPAPLQAPAHAPPAAAPNLLVDVGGQPGLKVEMRCRVVEAAGQERVEAAELLVPGQRAFAAEAISCRVEKQDAPGRLQVVLLLDDWPIAGATTRAAYDWVEVRSGGPWGPAQGRVGKVGLVPHKRQVDPRLPPALDGGGVPRFEGTIVPPLEAD